MKLTAKVGLPLFAVLICLHTNLRAQPPPPESSYPADWIPYGSGPVVPIGGPGSSPYESYHTRNPHVLIENGVYRMWYSGYRPGGGDRSAICYATSTNKGKTWTKHGHVVWFTEAWEAAGPGYPGLSNPTVIKDGDVYKMWYGDNRGRTGFITSADGVTWPVATKIQVHSEGHHNPMVTKGSYGYRMYYQRLTDGIVYPLYCDESADGGVSDPWRQLNGGNPVLVPEPGEWWYPQVTASPWVFSDPLAGRYHMWFAGYAADGRVKLGLATSTDGLDWETHDGNPLFSGTAGGWNDRIAYDSCVVLDPTDRTYRMFYTGYPQGRDRGQIGLAEAQAPLFPPVCTASGAGTYECGVDTITLGGTVSDNDGDVVSYQWREGTTVLFSGTVQTTAGGAPVDLPEHALSASSLGLDVHVLTLAVHDGVYDEVACDIEVEVVDTEAPTLAPVASPSLLWPPNHKLVTVTIQANAGDGCDALPLLDVSVTSNEPDNGLGDGDTTNDIQNLEVDQATGTITVDLRAERSGKGDGRIYTITITATDRSGNASMANVEITVPHSKGKKKK